MKTLEIKITIVAPDISESEALDMAKQLYEAVPESWATSNIAYEVTPGAIQWMN